MPYVPRTPRALVPHMPDLHRVLRVLVSHVPGVLCAIMLYILHTLYALLLNTEINNLSSY